MKTDDPQHTFTREVLAPWRSIWCRLCAANLKETKGGGQGEERGSEKGGEKPGGS